MSSSFQASGFLKPKTAKNADRQFKQYEKDRFGQVLEYRIGSTVDSSVVVIKEIDTGKILEISVSAESLARNRANMSARGDAAALATAAKYLGWSVDARMQHSIPVNSWLVAERCKTSRNVQVNGEQRSLVTCNYIKKIPVPSANKAFRAVVTASSFAGRVNALQVWEDRAIDGANETAIMELGDKMQAFADDDARRKAVQAEQGKEATKNWQYPPNYGIRLRALVPDGVSADGHQQFKTVNTTGALSHLEAVRDAAGNIVQPSRPMGKADLVDVYNRYSEYIDQTLPKDQYPDLRIEVMPFRNYKTGVGDSFDAPRKGSNLWRMLNTLTKQALDDPDEDRIKEQNWAVDAIVVLTADNYDQAASKVYQRNLVSAVYTNGVRGNLDRLVASSEGGRVTPDARLDAVREPLQNDSTASGPANSAARDAAYTPPASGLVQPAADPFYEQAFTDAPPAPIQPAQIQPAPAQPAPVQSTQPQPARQAQSVQSDDPFAPAQPVQAQQVPAQQTTAQPAPAQQPGSAKLSLRTRTRTA